MLTAWDPGTVEALSGLLDGLSELVYVVDLTSDELLYMNSAGREMFGSQGDVMGKKCYQVIRGRETPCENCTTPFLSEDRFYTWELTNPLVGRHYLLKDKLIPWEGRRARIEIAFDMTEKARQQAALQQTLDAENVLLGCARVLHGAREPGRELPEVLGRLGSFLEAEQVYACHLLEGRVANVCEWCASGRAAAGEMQGLALERAGAWEPLLKEQSAVTLDGAEEIRRRWPQAAAALEERGTERVALAPLRVDGRLVGHIGVENPAREKLGHLKPLLEALGYFLVTSLQRQRDRTRLEELSYRDQLTGALNRNAFERDLRERFSRWDAPLGAVGVSLNGMKSLNDREGHPAGDRRLCQTAQRIAARFGWKGLYRLGGDEFVFLGPAPSVEAFHNQADALRAELSGGEGEGASLGCEWSAGGDGAQALVTRADERMDGQKRRFYRGRAVPRRYRRMYDDALGLTNPETLREQLRAGRFLPYFQPKVSLRDGSPIGAEALARLLTAEGSVAGPDQFIPALEDARLIGAVDVSMFERVCAKIREWLLAGRRVLPVSVNFSRCTLSEGQFLERLEEIWRRYRIPRELLELEMTESVEFEDGFDLYGLLGRLRGAGYAVSIDDFGVRHANLSLFASADFDVLKVDRSLVMNLPQNPKAQAVVQSIAGICRRMGVRLVAEGVETEEQARLLLRLHCDGAQGFLFGRPMPEEEYERRFVL